MNFFAFVASFCIFQLIRIAFACNGYNLKISGVKNGANNNLKLGTNTSVELTADCKLSLKACFTLEKGFTSAKLSYEVRKGWFSKSVKDVDFCETIKKCPISEKGIYCTETPEPGNVSTYKDLLFLIQGDVTISGAKVFYDGAKTGPDTFDIILTLYKK